MGARAADMSGPASPPSADRLVPLLLLPVLGLAAAVRFAGLSQRGLLYWDEGKFALEGLRIFGVLQHLPAVSAGTLVGKAIGTAKPTHALLIALAYAMLGVRDYAPLYLDAAASLATVAATYALGTRLFDRVTGLTAAALLAISGYDIIYGRSALSESDAELMLVLSVWAWWTGFHRPTRCSRPWFLATGLLLGAAFTTNYRALVYIAALGLVAAIASIRRDGVAGLVRDAVPCLLGVSVFPLVWEAIALLARAHGITLFRDEIHYRPVTYWQEVLYQLHGGKQAILRFDPLLYPRWYLVRQGVPLSILLGAAIVVALVRRSLPYVVPLALILVPLGAFTFAPFIVPRNISAAVPFAAILSAACLTHLASRVQSARFRPVGAAVGAVIALITLPSVIPLTRVHSGFARAAGSLKARHVAGAFVDDEVMVFYLRDPGLGCDAPHMPWRVADLSTAARLGDVYAVVAQPMSPAERYLVRHATLLAHFPLLGTSLPENLVASENGLPPGAQSQGWVGVYSLAGMAVPTSMPELHPWSCTLDRLA